MFKSAGGQLSDAETLLLAQSLNNLGIYEKDKTQQ